jgi:hypothetical protein
VKLNNRIAFGQTLNMKRFSLEAAELLDKHAAKKEEEGGGAEEEGEEEEGSGSAPATPTRARRASSAGSNMGDTPGRDGDDDEPDVLAELDDADFEYERASHRGQSRSGRGRACCVA